MTARVDLVPGNTRLRARWPAILRGEQLPRTPAETAAVLRRTGPGRGPADPAALLDAVDSRRDDLLRAAVGAYEGAARDLVVAVVSDADRADLVTLLRGAATEAAPERILAAVRAVGRFDPPTVRELVADEPGALLARLVARRLPDPDTARAVAQAWSRFELHRDLAELEVAAARAHAEATLGALARFGAVADPVREHLDRRRDAANLVTAVRLRARGDAGPDDLLPPGAVPLLALRRVAAGADVTAAAPLPWRRALSGMTLSGMTLSGMTPSGMTRRGVVGADALARALDGLIEDDAVRPARRTDPLGAGVPIAYVTAVTVEARALRRAALATGGPDATEVPAA